MQQDEFKIETSNRSFYDENNDPILKNSYCIFADILGFKELTKQAAKNNVAQELLHDLHKIITPQAKAMKPGSKSSYWQTKFFTDNVVLGYSIFTSETEPEFGSAIMDARAYELEMAYYGYFIRGGMSLGGLFMDENLVFGPGLIDAYELEQTALYPRVILSQNVVQSINGYLKFYGDPKQSPENHDVLVDSDGQYFINYLYGVIEYGEGDSSEMIKNLITHKLNIEKNLALFAKDNVVWPKYKWLAEYHDYFCREFEEYIGNINNCLIDSNLSAKHPSRLVK